MLGSRTAELQEICYCYSDQTKYELLADEITTEVCPAATQPPICIYPHPRLQAWNDAGEEIRAAMRSTWLQRLGQRPGDMIIRSLKPLSVDEERRKAARQQLQLKEVPLPIPIPFLVHSPLLVTSRTFASGVPPAHRRQAQPRAARSGCQGRLDTAQQGPCQFCCQPAVSSCHHWVLYVAGSSREPRGIPEVGSTRVQTVVSLALRRWLRWFR